jgi:hypothetical protein
VFDETVFPFSKLNPNAGARLYADILLLPTTSQPSTVPGSGVEFSDDSCVNVQLNPVSINPCGSHAVVARNSVYFDAKTGPVHGSLMRSGLEEDLHASSALGTAGRELSTDHHVACSGAAHVSSSGAGRHALALGAAHRSPLGANCGSSVVRPSTPIPLVPNSYPTDLAPAHPSTRLQHGICKPKVYIDGTVRYGLHASSGEPNNHHEALENSQ